MKTKKEEAKIWFKILFDNCYQIKKDDYPNSIFWVYDTSRICKLNRVLGEKNDLKYKKEIIFEQDKKNHYFWIKYSGYWQFLREEFRLNYDEVKSLTKDVVDSILNCNQYTTCKQLNLLPKLKLKNKQI